MKKGTIKSFIEKHKTAFAVATGVTMAAVTGAVGYKLGWNKHIDSMGNGFFIPNIGVTEPVCEVLSNLPRGTDVNLFGGYNIDTPFTADQLGELGKVMIGEGATDETFTHFIAFGKK